MSPAKLASMNIQVEILQGSIDTWSCRVINLDAKWNPWSMQTNITNNKYTSDSTSNSSICLVEPPLWQDINQFMGKRHPQRWNYHQLKKSGNKNTMFIRQLVFFKFNPYNSQVQPVASLNQLRVSPRGHGWKCFQFCCLRLLRSVALLDVSQNEYIRQIL